MNSKKITSLICAGALLSSFAAAPVVQTQAYTTEVRESCEDAPPMPDVLRNRVTVNHVYDLSGDWGDMYDYALIMPGDTYEMEPLFSDEVGGETTATFMGNFVQEDGSTAPYYYTDPGCYPEDFDTQGEVIPTEDGFLTKMFTAGNGEEAMVNICRKLVNDSVCPVVLWFKGSGHGTVVSGRHYDFTYPQVNYYKPYYSITYPGYDSYFGDYFWPQGDYKTLDFPSYYYLSDIEYSITLPNPRKAGKHFLCWISDNEEINGDYSNIPVGWDKNRRKSSFNYTTGLVNRTEDVSIAPQFENGYTITFECRGGAIDGSPEYIAEVPLTNDGTFKLEDYEPKKEGDTFLGWCTEETAYYDSFVTKDDETKIYGKYLPETYVGLNKPSKNVTLYAKWANDTDEALERDGWKLDDDGTLWIVTAKGNQGWIDAKTADETLAPKVKSLETVYKDYSCSGFIDGTFTGCSSLVDLVIPENGGINGREQFKDCTSLKTITIKGTSFYFQTHHWDSAIYNAPKDLVIKLPDLSEEEAREKMGGYAYLLDDCKRYDLMVNNKLITDNHLTVQCGDGTATFDPETNTLTLENAELKQTANYIHYALYDPYQGSYRYAVISSALPKLNVVLKGKNNVARDSVDGIQSYGELSVTGDGSLETYFTNTSIQDYDSDTNTNIPRTDNFALGITADGDLELDGISGTRLNVKSKADLNVKNVTLKGGVFTAANDLTITNSEFAEFTPVKSEGSLLAVDHCANLTGANITVDECKFEKGRITPPEDCASITIKDSIFDLDGKLTAGDSTKLTIEGSTFMAVGQSDGVTNIPTGNIALKGCEITKGDWTAKGEFEVLPTSQPNDTDDGEEKKSADLDGDGQITANDALEVLRASAGASDLTPEQKKIADVDGDGDITSNDALIVLRLSVGLGG